MVPLESTLSILLTPLSKLTHVRSDIFNNFVNSCSTFVKDFCNFRYVVGLLK